MVSARKAGSVGAADAWLSAIGDRHGHEFEEAVVVLACASGMAMPTSIRKGSVPPLLPRSGPVPVLRAPVRTKDAAAGSAALTGEGTERELSRDRSWE